LAIGPVRRRARLTGGVVDGADRHAAPADDEMIATLLRRYLNGAVQRNEEIRQEIRAYHQARGLRSPI
jgi:hypothetical protein